MTSKTKWTFQELQKATQEELLQIVADCEAISDAQAINSDLEGESDADDNLPLTKQFIPSQNLPPGQNDSDDSVKDPDYEYSGSDSGSEMTNACNSGMNECQGALDISTKDVENDEDEPEETGADGDDIEFIWTKIGSQPKTYKDFNYNQPQGVKDIVGLTNGTIDSPVQYFHAIFSDVVYDMIITESNRYAEQKGVGLNFQRDELQAFFGMLLIMGFHTLPSLRLYWSTDQNFHVSRISNVMSQKRFLHILRYLHLNDNEVMPQRGQENFDKLYKIRPLVDILNERFSTLYAPYRELSIDESMVGFKGRTTLKQYMPMKPVKRGFKVWVIACSRTGYNLGFKIYEGKEQTDSAGISLGERTVLTMSDKYNETNIVILIPDLTKTSKSKLSQPSMVFPYFSLNQKLCVASCIRKYLNATSTLRNPTCGSLFITHSKPHGAATKQPLSRWVKDILKQAGVDTTVFQAHSTRHASTSSALRNGVSIDTIRKSAGWSTHSDSFAKFYNRPLSESNNFAETVLSGK
ncbi:unnamed protein product [Acanthoscelides obtectus]|uniref:PiggyBac transposable element-derived protein domain-containing protein n=1 Tax=Acanthoscelides obtectus TaxID=200917 RepID=A0A9P0Q595_ACAOB|nr:unnamed protein product [Acanthoscelides obtectus]CAK1689478.1 PiggyBac transposable element-derived protein 4 [Acanthoscelides obtectus]